MHNAMVIIIILVYHLIGYVATMRPKGVMGTLLRSNNPMFWNTLGVVWVSVSRQVENQKKKKNCEFLSDLKNRILAGFAWPESQYKTFKSIFLIIL